MREDRPDFLLLPEVWAFQGGSPDERRAAAETIPGGEAYRLLQDLAARHGVIIHGGSFLEQGPERLFNTTVVFGRDGAELARYRKLHLFDVVTPDGREYRESALVGRGDAVVTYAAQAPGVPRSAGRRRGGRPLRPPGVGTQQVQLGPSVPARPLAWSHGDHGRMRGRFLIS